MSAAAEFGRTFGTPHRYDEDGVFKFARVLRERRLAQQQHPQIGRNGFDPQQWITRAPVLLARSWKPSMLSRMKSNSTR